MSSMQCQKLGTKYELNDLPYDVVFSILLRLPITTLVQIQCTCKLWRDIIKNDTLFSVMQFLRTVKNPGLIYTLEGSSTLYYVDNPLCWLEVTWSIYICNPITGDRFKLPTLTPPVKDTYRGSWGFGYAPLSKKYKYVQIIPKRIRSKLEGREHFTYTYTYTAEIFTLGGESWRELACVPLGLMSRIYPTADVYCNGTLYWAMSPSFNDVVSFDLETEEFQERRVLYPEKMWLSLSIFPQSIRKSGC
ncbi:hypothetical protein IFM89_020070 [Coptis chinensis]|uniref:F-box domain-containing protein n=1 Tax=Coptis chinensis TaxID=261450 RepID=A0A835LEZ7_9MAGN|nr:hypothetical protein IFM89_020070 [Coptis chinensis]